MTIGGHFITTASSHHSLQHLEVTYPLHTYVHTQHLNDVTLPLSSSPKQQSMGTSWSRVAWQRESGSEMCMCMREEKGGGGEGGGEGEGEGEGMHTGTITMFLTCSCHTGIHNALSEDKKAKKPKLFIAKFGLCSVGHTNNHS